MICVMLMAMRATSKLNIKGSKNIGMKANAVCYSIMETQTSIDEFHQSVFFLVHTYFKSSVAYDKHCCAKCHRTLVVCNSQVDRSFYGEIKRRC